MDKPRIGLIGLHDLAPHLQKAGFRVITGEDLRAAVQEVQAEVGKNGRFDVLVLNSRQVAPLIPRIYQQVNLTVIGTDQAPCGEPNGFLTYQLEDAGSTVIDVLKNSGLSDGPDTGLDYEQLPAGLQFDAAGTVIDPTQDSWTDWLPGQEEEDNRQSGSAGSDRNNPWLVTAHHLQQEEQPPREKETPAFDADAFQTALRGGAMRAGEAEVVVTLSGSGGTAKSTTAYALADRAANRGKRVILMDLCLGQPDLSILLRVADAHLPTMLNAVFAEKITAGLIGPDKLNEVRDARLDKLNFAFLQGPTGEQLNSGAITSTAVFNLIDQAREIADLVVVDTQIIESNDPRGMVNSVIFPIMARGGWGLAVSTLANAGLNNLIAVMRRLQGEGEANPARIMSILTRVPDDVEIDQSQVYAALREYSVYRGTVWADSQILTRTNAGQSISDLPVLANVLDGILNRIFDDLPVDAPVFDPHASAEKSSFLSRLFGSKKQASNKATAKSSASSSVARRGA